MRHCAPESGRSNFSSFQIPHAVDETVKLVAAAQPAITPQSTFMRLIFSDSYYKNTDISDEEGNKLYTVSTPRGWKQVTTITKHRAGKRRSRAPEVLCVIEWHKLKKTKFRFGEREVEEDAILFRRPYSWGRYFKGPDSKTYKWKVGFRYCWVNVRMHLEYFFAAHVVCPLPSSRQLKNETKHERVHLVKFHKRNFGIRKPSHPPFLEVAEEVAHMLDHIIVTYIYMERIRRDVEDEKENL